MTETALAIVDGEQKTEFSIADVKKYFAQGATDKELYVFVNTAQMHNLNPVKREIYFVKYGNQPGQSVIGYQTYIKRAEKTGKLDGWKCEIVDDKNMKAVVTIHRKDQTQPFVWEVDRDEFDKKQSTWKSMPRFMLKKVAIGQAFRLAFPDELGGLPYVEEEAPTGEIVEALPGPEPVEHPRETCKEETCKEETCKEETCTCTKNPNEITKEQRAKIHATLRDIGYTKDQMKQYYDYRKAGEKMTRAEASEVIGELEEAAKVKEAFSE